LIFPAPTLTLLDGSDIRLTSSGGTVLLDHWIEAYDNSAQEAFLSVEVPFLTGSGSETLYMYYDNPAATSTSSWTNAFTSASTPISASGSIYSASTYDAFPATELLANGDVISAFHAGSSHVGADGKIMLARSTDGSSTWTTSTAFDQVSMDDRINVGLAQLSDGTLRRRQKITSHFIRY
jgi:hypothetical protein